MNCCKTILCIIDPDARGEQVLIQAAAYTRRIGARLVAAHFVDHHTGFESDHVPFITPMELNEALAKAALERIRAMLERIEPTASAWVEVGDPKQCAVELAQNAGATLVIVGALNACGFTTGQANTTPDYLPFEVLTIAVRRSWNPLGLLRAPTGRGGPAVLGIIQA